MYIVFWFACRYRHSFRRQIMNIRANSSRREFHNYRKATVGIMYLKHILTYKSGKIYVDNPNNILFITTKSKQLLLFVWMLFSNFQIKFFPWIPCYTWHKSYKNRVLHIWKTRFWCCCNKPWNHHEKIVFWGGNQTKVVFPNKAKHDLLHKSCLTSFNKWWKRDFCTILTRF